MSPHDAAKILDLPADATPEQIEARFHELRARLEDKIAKAPTPGLKAKYRESLEEVTAAFEAMTLAADSSSLPVLSRQAPAGGQPAAKPPTPTPVPASESRAASVPTAPKAKSGGGKEFLLVAIIAVLALGAGGWWVMKTRAENEEKARLAAEQKAEAERQAAETKQREEAEKARFIAAEKAEKERREKQLTQLRGRMAELNISYDALARQEQVAERQLGEFKTQLRELTRDRKGEATPEIRRAEAQLAAQERFSGWLADTLPVHPAKIARAKAEELLSARALEEADTAVETYASALNQLKSDIATARDGTVITGALSLTANQEGVQWELVDAFGQVRQGTTPATVRDAALGKAEVIFRLPPYPEQKKTVAVAKSVGPAVHAEFQPAIVTIQATPAHARIILNGAPHDNDTAFQLSPTRHQFRIEAEGFAPREFVLQPKVGEKFTRELKLDNNLSSQALEEVRSLARELRKKGALIDLAHLIHAIASTGDNESAVASAIEFGALGSLFTQPYEIKTDLSLDVTAPNADLAAALLMFNGENPFAKGLKADQFFNHWGTVGMLCARGRADLAFEWIALARSNGVSGGEDYPHIVRVEWCKLAAAAVRQGRLDLARQAFDQGKTASSGDSYNFEGFRLAARELWQSARNRADSTALSALADFALAAARERYSDRRYDRNDAVLVDAVHFFDWADLLVASGWSGRLQPYVDFILSNHGSLEEPLNPAKPVPFVGTPSIVQLQSWFATVSAKPSDIGGRFVKISANLRARQALARGQPELARKHAAYGDNDYKPLDLARDFARLGNWKAADDLIPSLHSNALVQSGYRNEFARHHGSALAEQLEPAAALARVREINSPEARLNALCALLIRLREIKDFTPEQRALLRQMPLI